jgi:HEAT repeat protein
VAPLDLYSLEKVFQTKQQKGAYVLPADGLTARWVQKLQTSSRRGLRFAKSQLRKTPQEALPLLLDSLSKVEGDSTQVGYLLNLCAALGATQSPEAEAPLLNLLQTCTVPVVRTGAAEALAQLESLSIQTEFLERAQLEMDPAVIRAMFSTIARIGGPKASHFLGARAQSWMAGDPMSRSGLDAWKALLWVEDASSLSVLQSMESILPPPLLAEGLARRVALGEKGLTESLRSMLNPEKYPSGTVRLTAVIGLASAEDWPGVLLAAQDPDFAVRKTVIDALQLPGAVDEGVGLAHLMEWAADPSPTHAYPAIHALMKQGRTEALEPWLQLVSGFPLDPGSVGALLLFRQEGLEDPRLAPLLLSRWPYCDSAQRVDLLRILGRVPDVQVLEKIKQILHDPKEQTDVKEQALTSLALFGADGLTILLEYWNPERNPQETERIFSTSANLSSEADFLPWVDALLTMEDLPPLHLKFLIDILPLKLAEKAYPRLLGIYQSETRPTEVVRYVEALLKDYY